MNPRQFLLISIALTLCHCTRDRAQRPISANAVQGERPNIVLIYTDDMGYSDMGAYGGEHVSTPHLDRLAEDGVRFTDFRVAQAVCTASRASLLTGCYPNRVNLRGALDHTAERGLAPAETTLAELLAGAGYRTHMVGKWHLGHFSPYLPTDQGFETYLGIPYSHDMWGGHPEPHQAARFPRRVPLLEGTQLKDSLSGFAGLTRMYNERAVQIVAEHDTASGPLLLYLAHSMPHVPLDEDVDYLDGTGKGLYADVMAEIDASVGELRAELARRGMADNTLILFASDNGPWLSYGEHAGRTPFREGKGTSWEGGVRVPLLTYWPGHTAAGTVSTSPLMTIDVLPSLASLVGADLPERKIDGHDRLNDLLGTTQGPAPEPYAIYWIEGLEAVVSADGRWKLHFPHEYRSLAEGQAVATEGYPVRYTQRQTDLALYDLENDPGESTDVAEKHPAVIDELKNFADGVRTELGDALQGLRGTEVREM